jgi:hypothetical protein
MSDFNDLMRKVYLMEQKLMITLITNIFQFSCVLSSDISPFFSIYSISLNITKAEAILN